MAIQPHFGLHLLLQGTNWPENQKFIERSFRAAGFNVKTDMYSEPYFLFHVESQSGRHSDQDLISAIKNNQLLNNKVSFVA